MSNELRWFGAKLLYRAVTRKGNKLMMGEESVRLVRARSLEHAEACARQMAPDGDDETFRVGNLPCRWTGPEVLDVFEMCEEPSDGAEVYSNMMPLSDVHHLEEVHRGDE